MMPLVAGLILFWLGSILLRHMQRMSPAVLARAIRRGGGTLLLGLALLLLMRGQVGAALGIGGFGVWVMAGRQPFLRAGRRRPRARPRGRVSQVRSATIEMELDHVTGVMSGLVLAGPFEGRSLQSLDRDALRALHAFCRSADGEGARLLEAYFDRRFPGWREAQQDGRDARSGAETGAGRGGRSQSMSEEEACQILGLAKGASREEVARAHRSLMKKAHPDHGGSTDLAARANEAKDVLMRRHQ